MLATSCVLESVSSLEEALLCDVAAAAAASPVASASRRFFELLTL